MYGYGMFLATNGIVQSGGGVDADALSFITTTGITDATQKSAINQLVLDFKSGNVWSGFEIIRPFIGGTSLSHAVNLKNPSTFQANFYGGMTHDQYGIVGNTLNGYMANNYSYSGANKDSFSVGYYARNTFLSTIFYFGATQSTRIEIYNEPNIIYWAVNSTTETYLSGQTDANKKGLYVVDRNASNSKKLYKNGSQISSDTDTSTSFPVGDVYVLARSTSTGAQNYSAGTCSFFFIGRSFNSSEQTIINNAITTFQTTLGRNV